MVTSPSPAGALALGPTGGAWESVRTWANLATVIRTAIAVPFGLYSVLHPSVLILVLAYASYWLGDMFDGFLARRLHQETRIGAVLDIVSDRASCAILVCALAVQKPGMWPALGVYIGQFMVLDTALTLSFLAWPTLVSPNYFYRVNRTIYRYNWAEPAKVTNTIAVVIAVASGQLFVALPIALAQLALKIWTTRRVLALRPGELTPQDG